MKKTLAFLVFSLAFTGMTFASFHVEKSNEVSNANTTVVDNRVAENGAAVATSNAKMESNAETSSSSKESDKNSTMAIILALVSVIFLPFGLHNWYLGRTKQALWQTILTVLIITFPISWIWQVVDLIRLLINGSL